MKNEELVERSRKVLFQNYRPQPIALVRGEGTLVFDADERRYLDFIGGIATVCLGHANPRVQAALVAQSEKIWHASNLFLSEPQVRLAEKLVARSFADRVFFCNSGAEANEGMIKLARHYHVAQGDAERIEILCMHNSFHGRTMGALAATGQPKYRQGFGPLPEGFRFLPFGDASALAAAISDRTCAVLLEPVQGEAGVVLPPRGYLARVRELCSRHGALMLLDEVQSGMGRTGRLFCYEHEGVEPDAMSLAKGIAGGVPLGALLAREEIARTLTPGTHASTFGGNPLTTAAACAVLDLIDEPLLEQVRRTGERLSARLSALAGRTPRVAGERGIGLWRALLLAEDIAARVVGRARELGLLVNGIGERTLRLAPPLTVSDAEIEEAADLLLRAVLEA